MARRTQTFWYWLVSSCVKLWQPIYFRSISIKGIDNVPLDKPVLLAPNHQNAFMDALLVLRPFSKQLYFLARADVFENPIMAAIMRAFHMLPIYRPRDGKNSREKNMAIFNACYELLGLNQMIMIHPEGNCFPRKEVRMFRKGFAHMAFGAQFEKGVEDVQVVPINIEYQKHDGFRYAVDVYYEEPISVAKYEQMVANKYGHAVNNFRNELQGWAETHGVDFPNDEHYKSLEWLTQHYAAVRKTLPSSVQSQIADHDDRQLMIHLSNAIKRMRNQSEETFERWIGKLTPIFKDFQQRGLDYLPLRPDLPSAKTKRWLFRLSSPFASVALIHFWPAHRITEWFVDSQVADAQFVTSIRFLFQMFLMPISLILISTLVGSITGSYWIGGGYFLIIYLMGLMSRTWLDWKRDLRGVELWNRAMEESGPHHQRWKNAMKELGEQMAAIDVHGVELPHDNPESRTIAEQATGT
jgi:1-acyl-sn-glycerol-3-phosphate acyltransferase